jgi:hypothetical protein
LLRSAGFAAPASRQEFVAAKDAHFASGGKKAITRAVHGAAAKHIFIERHSYYFIIIVIYKNVNSII